MELLKKFVKRKTSVSSRNNDEIKDTWQDNGEEVLQGVSFSAFYLGSMVVEDISEDKSYGNGLCLKAVNTIIKAVKKGRMPVPVGVTVTIDGVIVRDSDSKLLIKMSVFSIAYCGMDKRRRRVFSFIGRHKSGIMETFAFLCSKRRTAKHLTLAVARSFALQKLQEDASYDRKWAANGLLHQSHHKVEEGNLDLADSSTGSQTSGRSSPISEPIVDILVALDSEAETEDLYPADDDNDFGCFVKSRAEYEMQNRVFSEVLNKDYSNLTQRTMTVHGFMDPFREPARPLLVTSDFGQTEQSHFFSPFGKSSRPVEPSKNPHNLPPAMQLLAQAMDQDQFPQKVLEQTRTGTLIDL